MLKSLQNKIQSIKRNTRIFSSIRQLACLPREYDLTDSQWYFIQGRFKLIENEILQKLETKIQVTKDLESKKNLVELNDFLGKLELELSKGHIFFDTYLDILSQRNNPNLASILSGCDVLALDAIRKNHPKLTNIREPLVHLDRGFGASTLRSGILIRGKFPNPLPLIQIPYSKLTDKLGLVSILHEVGHTTLEFLGLTKEIASTLHSELTRQNAPKQIADYYALYSKEIGPDYWAWLCSGIAQTAGTKEFLSLPKENVFRVSENDYHPPPWIRCLQSIQWSQTQWPLKIFSNWQKVWLELYPIEEAPKKLQSVLLELKKYLPMVNRILFHNRFSVLNGKKIPDLFDLEIINPKKLEVIAEKVNVNGLNLENLNPTSQLAVFRMIKEKQILDDRALDSLLIIWLKKLSEKRKKTIQLQKMIL